MVIHPNVNFLKRDKVKNLSKKNIVSNLASVKKAKFCADNNELVEKIRKAIDTEYFNGKKIYNLEKRSFVLKAKIIAKVLSKVCDLAIDELNQVYIMNYDTQIMDGTFEYVKNLILLTINKQIHDRDFEIEDIDTFTRRVVAHMIKSNFRPLTRLKQGQVVLNNCVIDLKKCTVEELAQVTENVDVMSRLACNFMPLSVLNKKEKDQAIIHRNIINRLMDDWSDGDPDKKKLLWQIVIACLEGWNRGRFFIIHGPGGNGKSTFMKLIAKICQVFTAHSSLTVVNCGIHQFSDDNVIGKVSEATHVILGDDAPSNHIVHDITISRLKTLTTRDAAFTVNMKYQPAREITSCPVFIQSTNTHLRLNENSDAVADRTIVVFWTKTNYRKNPTDEFDLDELLQNSDFLDQFVTMAIEEAFSMGYFTKFHVTANMLAETSESLDEEDVVSSYFADNFDYFKHYEMLSVPHLYEAFKDYHGVINPNTKAMSLKTFTNRLELIVSRYNFEFYTNAESFENRRHFGSDSDYSTRSLLRLLGHDKTLRLRGRCLVNLSDDKISQDQLNSFETELNAKEQLDVNKLSSKERVMIAMLAAQGHTTAIQYEV